MHLVLVDKGLNESDTAGVRYYLMPHELPRKAQCITFTGIYWHETEKKMLFYVAVI